jgi:hypothetical protein
MEGLADAPFRSAWLVLSNHDRPDTENGYDVVGRLRTTDLVVLGKWTPRYVIDSSRQ